MKQDICILRKDGRIYRIKKAPFETNDQATERLWFIANNPGKTNEDSLKWMYEKYIGVRY